MSRVDEYRAHLTSDEWRVVRTAALEITGGLCAFCGAEATQVHHVRYPKQFPRDSLLNVQPVCDDCHKKAHGILDMKNLTDPNIVSVLSMHGDTINLLSDGPMVYGSIASWLLAMRVPKSLSGRFSAIFEKQTALKTEYAAASYRGVAVYRWQAAARSLATYHDDYVRNPPKWNDPDAADRHQLDGSYQAMLDWLFNVTEKVIAEAYQKTRGEAGQSITPIADGVSLLATINKLIQSDQIIAASVDEARGAIPCLSRPKDDPVTVKDACFELSYSPDRIAHGGHNLAQRVGAVLRRDGYTKCGERMERLDAGRAVPVGLWKRGDVYKVIREVIAATAEQ